MSPVVAQKLRRLQVILTERTNWAAQLAQVKRMRQWVLDAEHILDRSWAQADEVVTHATVGERLDAWRELLAEQVTDGRLSELERECLTEFLRVLTNEAPVPGAVLRPQRLSPDEQRARTQHSRAQDPVSPHQRAQELEQLFVTLRALGRLCGLVGAGCGSSPATGAPSCSPGSRALVRTATGNQSGTERAAHALSLPPQAPGLSCFARGALGWCLSPAPFALTVFS